MACLMLHSLSVCGNGSGERMIDASSMCAAPAVSLTTTSTLKAPRHSGRYWDKMKRGKGTVFIQKVFQCSKKIFSKSDITFLLNYKSD